VFGVNGWEIILLALLAVFILGPERLPEYAAKLAHGIRKLRVMAEGARGQLRDQLGPEYEDIDWRQYDPRQYDPRRIVRDALREPLDDAINPLRDEIGSVRTAARRAGTTDDDDTPVRASVDSSSNGSASPESGTSSAPYVDAFEPEPVSVPSVGAYDPARPTPYDSDAT
jgi:sec-independent protein translocase protein TatB